MLLRFFTQFLQLFKQILIKTYERNRKLTRHVLLKDPLYGNTLKFKRCRGLKVTFKNSETDGTWSA